VSIYLAQHFSEVFAMYSFFDVVVVLMLNNESRYVSVQADPTDVELIL